MIGHDYFAGVLEQHNILPFQKKRLANLRDRVEKALRAKHGSEPKIRYAGSYAKGTMIRDSFDLDIVMYFPHTDTRSLKEMFLSVYRSLKAAGHKVQPKTVSLQIGTGALHVDVVPAHAHDASFKYASLFRRDTKSPLKTSIDDHIDAVKKSGARDIIKLMKVWRVQRSLTKWKTFALEQIVIRALDGEREEDLAFGMIKTLEFIEANIREIRLVDPANSNNEIEMPKALRFRLQMVAQHTLNSIWKKILLPPE